ncbi:MAG: hypothetical protein ACOCWJ_02315 [Verrucomicrobiota bacterium]
MNDAWKDQKENEALKQEFTRRGLDPEALVEDDPSDLARTNRMLHQLLEWVEAYRETPDRNALARRGFQFPPIEPDCDPDTDWLRFERWINGEPTSWDASREVLTPEELEQMSDDEVEDAFARLCEFLAVRGVAVDFAGEIPSRLAYREVASSLGEGPIGFMGPTTTMHLDACNGCCPECIRRPWCEIGCENSWPEDEKAGHIVFPDAVKPYVSPAPGSLALLQKPNFD